MGKEMSDLVKKVARGIASHYGADPDKIIYESLGAANVGRKTPLWESHIGDAKAALAAIPSLSFDEAVENLALIIANWQRTSFMEKVCGKIPARYADKRNAEIILRTLTANGDVLIRSESISESPAQSAKE